MFTFQGFNITGIDRDKYPVFEKDQILYDKIYLILEPVEGCADVEAQKVWGDAFCYMVESWEQFQEFNHYKATLEKVPELRFVLEDYDKAFISAEGIALNPLLSAVSFVQGLVKFTNQRCIKTIEDIEYYRQHIDAFNSNSGHFSDKIRL